MSTFLVVGIIIILIIFISLLVILLNINSKNEKSSQKSSNSNIERTLVVDNIILPKKISQMDHLSLSKASKQVFESFKALDYVNKPSSKLDKVEWHTWQVSLLMAMFKDKKGFIVPSNDALFHEVILNTNENSLVQSTQRIIEKYNNNIDINKSRDQLSLDIFWSSKEVSILFYYMSKH
jgi:septation ring formation regulator EzrA